MLDSVHQGNSSHIAGSALEWSKECLSLLRPTLVDTWTTTRTFVSRDTSAFRSAHLFPLLTPPHLLGANWYSQPEKNFRLCRRAEFTFLFQCMSLARALFCTFLPVERDLFLWVCDSFALFGLPSCPFFFFFFLSWSDIALFLLKGWVGLPSRDFFYVFLFEYKQVPSLPGFLAFPVCLGQLWKHVQTCFAVI